jgi:hypothetical protein
VSQTPKRRPKAGQARPARKGAGKSSAPSFDERDPMGRMALFSEVEPQEPGSQLLWIECSSCLKETPVSPLDLAKAALPFSLHFPVIKRYHSYMRCTACRKLTWVRVIVRPGSSYRS